MSTPNDEYRALLEDRDEIISDLRAKLQAAEVNVARLREALERIVSPECEYRSETARSIARAALEGK